MQLLRQPHPHQVLNMKTTVYPQFMYIFYFKWWLFDLLQIITHKIPDELCCQVYSLALAFTHLISCPISAAPTGTGFLFSVPLPLRTTHTHLRVRTRTHKTHLKPSKLYLVTLRA